MDIVIFAVDDASWFFATPTLTERARAPFNIVAGRTWRIWPADGLTSELWEAAKMFFLELCDGDSEAAA